jgi:hypothetical protein
VFGAPDGTAVIWLLADTLGRGGGGVPSERASVVGAFVGLCAAEGLAVGAAVDGTLGTALGEAAAASLLGAVVGWPGALLSANAVSAPAPVSTAVQARAVSKLRVRI